jgi:predicted peptidase
VSSVNPADTTNDLFNRNYNSKTSYPYAGITPYRVAFMNSVLQGTRTKGNLWNAFWMGDVTVFTGEYNEKGNELRELRTVNRIFPYRLYIPKNYNPNIPSKFTFLLHGQTGNENAPIERVNDHFKNQPSPLSGIAHDSFENYCDVHNYIVLAPNGWTHGPSWGKGPGEQSMLAAYNLVKSKYNIDPDRTFIMGNSLGGAGTLNFAARHGEMFKAMVPSAPAPGKPTREAFKGAVLDLPTLLIQGTKDATIPYKETVDYYNNELKGLSARQK